MNNALKIGDTVRVAVTKNTVRELARAASRRAARIAVLTDDGMAAVEFGRDGADRWYVRQEALTALPAGTRRLPEPQAIPRRHQKKRGEPQAVIVYRTTLPHRSVALLAERRTA